MLTDFFRAGPNEIWNSARLQAYLTNVGSPFTTGAAICACSTLTPAMLGEEDGVYTTPQTDPAPWYDADLPASGEFLGFMPLSVSGLEDNPRTRSVSNAVGGGGVFGPVRELPRTITVNGLLIGTSCCGAEFGIHYLAEALASCTGDSCDGDCAEMYNCCPSEVMTPEDFAEQHRRTFRRVSLVEGPTVVDRTGNGTCAQGSCGVGGDLIRVEFVLVAASPWPWTDPIELLNVGLPIGGDGDCIDWCVRNGPSPEDDCPPSECSFAPCASDGDGCADPRNQVPTPPQPTRPEASFCIPIASERDCYTIDLSDRPQWSSDVPMVTVTSGSSELRNVRVSFYEKRAETTLTCEEIADAERCNPLNDFVITYVPANGAVTIDGQIGRAVIECNGNCRTASTVFGDQDGGPIRINELSCASYCVCVESDPLYPPAADATVSVSVSGRGY